MPLSLLHQFNLGLPLLSLINLRLSNHHIQPCNYFSAFATASLATAALYAREDGDVVVSTISPESTSTSTITYETTLTGEGAPTTELNVASTSTVVTVTRTEEIVTNSASTATTVSFNPTTTDIGGTTYTMLTTEGSPDIPDSTTLYIIPKVETAVIVESYETVFDVSGSSVTVTVPGVTTSVTIESAETTITFLSLPQRKLLFRALAAQLTLRPPALTSLPL